MLEYPSQLPVAEMQDVIATIRAGSFKTNSQHFAKDVWIIGGFALGQSVGEVPATVGIFGAAAGGTGTTTIGNQEAADYLQDVIDAHNRQPSVMTALPPIPWKQIAVWAAQILLQLLSSA